MSKETLNEDQMLAAIEAARASGDALALSKLMSEDHTELVASPNDDEGTPEQDVLVVTSASGTVEPPVTETPPKEAVVVEPPKKSADEPAAKDGNQPDDPEKKTTSKTGPAWVDALPDNLKEQVLKDFQDLYGQAQFLEQYRRSNEGRVSGLQKKVDTLQRKLDSSQKQSEPPPSNSSKAAPSSIHLIEDDPALAKLKEDDPALYEIHKKREEAILLQAEKLVEKAKAEFNSALENKISPINQERHAEYQRQQQDIVLTVIPNAKEVLNSQHWELFETNASDKVQQLINSDEADDVIAAFELYNRWISANFSQPTEAPKAPPVETPKAPAQDTAKVEEERKRKLNAGAPANKGSVTTHNTIADPEAALEEIFQAKWKQQGFDTRSR